jgi:hypothetical protein
MSPRPRAHRTAAELHEVTTTVAPKAATSAAEAAAASASIVRRQATSKKGTAPGRARSPARTPLRRKSPQRGRRSRRQRGGQADALCAQRHRDRAAREADVARGEGEGCANSVSCGGVVFVDEAAEPVTALDGGGRWTERSVRTDGSGGSRFSERCGLWLLSWSTKIRSTRSRWRRFTIRSQSKHSPRAVRTQMDASATQLDEEEHEQRPQRDRLDREEADREHLCACARRKVTPGESGSFAGRAEPGLPQNLRHSRRQDGDPETVQLTHDPLVAPARTLARQPQHQRADRLVDRRPPARPPQVQRRATSRRYQRSSVAGVTMNDRQLAWGSKTPSVAGWVSCGRFVFVDEAAEQLVSVDVSPRRAARR